MSLIQVQIPTSTEIIEQIKTNFNSRYSNYIMKRYSLQSDFTNSDWYNSLLDFMMHPYEERIDYHNIRNNHIVFEFDNDTDAYEFLINNIVINVGINLNKFDYYFQKNRSYITQESIGDKTTYHGTDNRTINDSITNNGMTEIAPINAYIDTISTPNYKNKNDTTGVKSDNNTSDNSTTNISFEQIKDFIKFCSYDEYENICIKAVDALVYEYNTIY